MGHGTCELDTNGHRCMLFIVHREIVVTFRTKMRRTSGV